MKRINSFLITIIAKFNDPLKKSEDFAVSLRKKKNE